MKIINDESSVLSAKWNAMLLFQTLVPQICNNLSSEIIEPLLNMVIAGGPV